MPRLQLETYGPGLHLCIGALTPEQKRRLEKRCPNLFGLYWKKSLDRLWYRGGTPLRDVMGEADWQRIHLPGQVLKGPLLVRRENLDGFLETLDVRLDGRRVDLPPDRITCRFQAAKPPVVSARDALLVFHGESYAGYTRFEADVDVGANALRLSLTFADGGPNGWVLHRAACAGQALRTRVEAAARDCLRLQFARVET